MTKNRKIGSYSNKVDFYFTFAQDLVKKDKMIPA